MASTHDIAQTKVLNKSGGKNLLRFASSRKRDAEASADVYRNYKRQSVLRETAVHHQRNDDDSSFRDELDLCLDRNASEVFHCFYRAVWPHVRSLAEVLHHKEKVVELLCDSLLEEEEVMDDGDDADENDDETKVKSKMRVPHHGTLDILHLVAVLARQLRHELDANVHSQLIPRILLILQPNTTATDVSFVEAAFRTIAYLLQYTTVELDALRPYYGATIAHSRQVARRLAAETFAPLIRQQPSSVAIAHLKQVLKVLAKQTANTSKNTTGHALDGVAMLCCHVAQSKKHQMAVVDLVVQMAQRSPTLLLPVARTVVQSLDTVVVWSHLLRPSKKHKREPLLLLELIEPQLRTSRWWTKEDVLDPLVAVLQTAIASDATIATDGHAVTVCLTLCNNPHAQISHIGRLVTHVLEPHWENVARRVLANVRCSTTLVSTLVASLLRFASTTNASLCLDICHGVACLGATGDDIFHVDHVVRKPNEGTAELISPEQQQQLVEILLGSGDWKISQTVAHTVAVLQGLTVAASAGGSNEAHARAQKTMFELIMEKSVVDDDDDVDQRVLVATALECWTLLQSFAKPNSNSSSLRRVQRTAAKLLLDAPTSVVVVKSVARLVQESSDGWLVSTKDDPDSVLDALIPNLRSECHWLRLHSLEILATLPKRPFVVDHAEIDWTDDLDEEADNAAPSGPDGDIARRGPTGLCPLIDTLLDIESTTPNLPNERSLTRWITSVANMARTGRLPILYAEAAVHHLLGTLFLKYSPLWSVSIDALVTLVQEHYDTVAGCVQQHLADMMSVVPARTEDTKDGTDSSIQERSAWETCYTKIIAWESSHGHDSCLFFDRISVSQENGTVSPFHSTDNVSVCDSLWRVVQGAPILVTRRSETLVPIFLRFLCFQYFALNPNDLDARELVLDEHVEKIDDDSEIKDVTLDSRAIFRRLGFCLRAFAAVSRPKGLYKEDVLLSIFTALCSHQDPQIAKTAFTCVSRFKVPHISPYTSMLSALYDKGKLRDALMQLKEASENETILVEHRRRMAPLVARILYGRLGSRATGVKSSKDSPQARRAAVLSFLASFTEDPSELYPFLYLMMRAYVSPSAKPKPLESQYLDDHQTFLTAVSEVSPEHCTSLPVQVNQGFLNALEAIISHLGRRVADAIPSALGIVLSILKAFEVSESTATDSKDRSIEDEFDDVAQVDSHNSRSGSIRSLCYRRIGEIFGNCNSISSLAPYHKTFWNATERSLSLLPQMAVSATRVPALLGLMKTLSQLEGTAHILSQNVNCIPRVFQCLSPQCKPAVIDAVLVIIDGLMRTEQSTGNPIVQPHLALMLGQFRARLECKTRESTWRLELDILCRASKLLSMGSSELVTSTIDSLCLLLVPYLDPIGFGGDNEKNQVLEIIDSLADKISETCANEIFVSLASFLGINKGAQGLVSLKLRFGVASIALKMGRSVYSAIGNAATVTAQLCSVNRRKVNEIDFDSVLSALASLSTSNEDDEEGHSWTNVCSKDGVCDPALCRPVVNCCFHFLFEEDGVVSRAAFKALRVLVSVACAEIVKEEPASLQWKRFLEGSVVSVMRSGLSARSEPVRRFFVLLLRDLVIRGNKVESDHIHKDLACLVRDDEPDLDFFHTITHVQVHRRARALQRLRKTISLERCPITPFSILRILLPLATHSIYESKANIDEAFALEGIATAGALARHLSWSKYSQVLSTHLSQFERNAEQEKYLVSLICSLIDAFHFDVGTSEDTNNSVRKSLENRLIPMIQKMLTKENKGKRSGQLLRPAIALALLKLIQKLPQKSFENKLHRLLIVICNVLNGRDSTARETARTTLGKMVVSMDVIYLSDVVRQLAISLSEGFRVHVRTATLHSVLLQLSTSYFPPSCGTTLQTQPSFDRAIPGCVDLIQQDLFGVAQERKEAKESHVRFVQEAQGSKAAHALELMATMVCFRPHGDKAGASISVQALVSPFLERLKAPLVAAKIIGRVRDCLTRIVAGLLKNPSVHTAGVLSFVGTNMVPFVKQTEIDSVVKAMYDDGSDDDEALPLKISGSKGTQAATLSQSTKGSVTTWQPSTLKMSTSVKEATDKKNTESAEMTKVRDGASAPKLTGSYRNTQPADEQNQRSVNSPASVRAAMFCLSLLSRKLKNEAKQIPDELLDPFVPLLATCACCCRDTEVSMLALKCLAWLLRTKLPSLRRCSGALAVKTLDLLVSSGKDEEQRQLAFKLLTLLLNFDQSAVSQNRDGGDVSLPLDSDQMQVLMSFLRESVERGDQYNQAIHLVKAIMARRFISVELYELVDIFLRQTVRSSRANLRQQSGSVFVNFLINYPLTPERIEEYLKQVVANLSYEDVDGRLSAIQLATSLTGKLPQELLESHCTLFFFPLTLQLSNDESKECKEALSACIGKLFESVSLEALQPLYDYTKQWSNGNTTLKRTSLQLFQVFAGARPEYLKKRMPCLLDVARQSIQSDCEWDVIYFSLLLVEKLAAKCSRAKIDGDFALWESTVKVMASHNHPWVQLVSCRLVESHLVRMDPRTFANTHNTCATFLCNHESAQLFQLGRFLCTLLQTKDGDEQEKSPELVATVIRCLTWTVPAMKANPALCCESDDFDGTNNPVRWILRRLSAMAKPQGPTRTLVFKALAALASKCYDCIVDYLEIVIEPLHRVDLESTNVATNANSFSAEIVQETISDEAKLAKDVMFLLEEQCPDDGAIFVQALATVQKEASERKHLRKIRHREEAVSDPQRYAQRRIEKQEKERKRRKRRVQEQRQQRTAKRSRGRHH